MCKEEGEKRYNIKLHRWTVEHLKLNTLYKPSRKVKVLIFSQILEEN